MEQMPQETVESKLITLAQKVAAEKLPSENISREEAVFAAKLALKQGEDNGDPYTMEEVSDPNSELQHLLSQFLKMRAEQRGTVPYDMVIDDKMNVVGQASTKEDLRKIAEKELRADNQ